MEERLQKYQKVIQNSFKKVDILICTCYNINVSSKTKEQETYEYKNSKSTKNRIYNEQ